jgi:hypothetical protein
MSQVIVLGAGASFGSPAPQQRIPMQRSFFRALKIAPPPLCVALLPATWPPLSDCLLAEGLGDASDLAAPINSEALNLEDVYAWLETSRAVPTERKAEALRQLDQVAFQAVSMPVAPLRNHAQASCPQHRALAQSLQPGDVVLSFNYDSFDR